MRSHYLRSSLITQFISRKGCCGLFEGIGSILYQNLSVRRGKDLEIRLHKCWSKEKMSCTQFANMSNQRSFEIKDNLKVVFEKHISSCKQDR